MKETLEINVRHYYKYETALMTKENTNVEQHAPLIAMWKWGMYVYIYRSMVYEEQLKK